MSYALVTTSNPGAAAWTDVGTLLSTQITTVNMGDAAHALVLTTPTSGAETRLLGTYVEADAQSTGGGENLTLPAAASMTGQAIVIQNVGGEPIILIDNVSFLLGLRGGDIATVWSNGTNWEGVAEQPRVYVVTAATGGSGGATAGTLTADLTLMDGTTAFAQSRIFLILASLNSGVPYLSTSTTVTFGVATKGANLASGNGWCEARTDTSGQFAVPTNNTADETVFFMVVPWTNGGTATGSLTYGLDIAGSTAASATWSA